MPYIEVKIRPMLDTHKAVEYHWRVWELTGIVQTPGSNRIWNLVRGILINTLITLLFPLTLVANLFFTKNLQQVCENLSITITDILANLKFLNVYVMRDELNEIRDLLMLLDKRARDIGDLDELEALHDAVKISRTSFRIFGGIFIFGTTLSCFRVAIATERVLLYPAWFWFDWECSIVTYIIILVYQLFGLTVQALQDCANDSYPPAYLCILTGHMRALEFRVRRLGQHTEKELNYIELNDCIDDYIYILELHAIIQKILSVPSMAQFVCSAAVQCAVGLNFLYNADSNDLSAMVLSMVFFMAVTLEVLIICYFGDRMRTQSEALLNAFYFCDWFDQLPKFKQNLIICLQRAQQPSLIYAGNYIPLTLESFVKIIRSTYSVFTVLLRAK
ncbi:odorant receptor 2a [Drosophila busckii]|uniref:odorant receptor 2a n=1 Tax=Drosophila busckii TaxID=30019 RepID=UPI00083F0F3F|nr:odorant receptor 2a [Drosophila busckii]